MEKIIQPLTREFLQEHGVQFNGATWSNPNSKFELTATDDENVWMVTIPGLPSNIPQPEPIKHYGDLMRLYLSIIGGYIEDKQKDIKFPDNKSRFEDIARLMKEFFEFDSMISLVLRVTPQGISILPNNAYTYTLINGNEFEFKIKYSINNEVYEREHSVAPECISTSYLLDLIKESIENKDSEIDILEVWINNQGRMERFFGSGVNFERLNSN